jgi:hypothetical protein
MFGAGFVNHDQPDQVLVKFCIQAFLADRAMKVERLTFFEIKPRMLDTGIVPNLRM